jgi:hypothetical protein
MYKKVKHKWYKKKKSVISDNSNKTTEHGHKSNMVIGSWLPVGIDHRKEIIKNKHHCPL